MTAASPPAAKAIPIRSFGRFGLRRLLGKSAATMVWLAHDPERGEELMLSLPRVQPVDADALEIWLREARIAARLNHPQLAPVAEVGVQDQWPFIAVLSTASITLTDWLAKHIPLAPDQAVQICADVLRGLAFGHEAGVAHRDLQLHSILIDERGGASVMALGAAGDSTRRAAGAAGGASHERALAMDPDVLRAQRAASARDVLACGLVLHGLLAGQPALEQPDIALAMAQMAPAGRELVRLGWTTPLPVPEALRAIANRCTSSQERLRYQNARTLGSALDSWRQANANDDRGPVGRLLDRLHSVGHLPALPGLGARVAFITSGRSQRTEQMAEHVLQDIALSFELLRTLNSAQVQGTQVAGDAPVLTLRRIISLIGENGVQIASNALRPWPGPLDEIAASALKTAMEQVRLAGHTAQVLRPAGYDAQVVYLVAMLQNLGRLMLRYHFADEAQQIAALMQAVPGQAKSATAATAEQPGLSEEQAAYAVLGVSVEALGAAVARHWRLGDEVLHMIRRVPPDAGVRKPDSDADMLRFVASAANEAVDVVSRVAPARVGTALAQVAQRYARALGIGARELIEALQAGRAAAQSAALTKAAAATRTPEGDRTSDSLAA